MDEHTLGFVAGGCVLLLLLVCYIIALVKSKKGTLVFTANGWDMVLLFGCPILYMVGWLGGMEPPISTWQYVVWGISAACLIGTVVFSVVSNMGNI